MRQRTPNRKPVVSLLRLRSPATMPHPSAAIARHGRSTISRRMQNGRSALPVSCLNARPRGVNCWREYRPDHRPASDLPHERAEHRARRDADGR
jgi:hypothetical protein